MKCCIVNSNVLLEFVQQKQKNIFGLFDEGADGDCEDELRVKSQQVADTFLTPNEQNIATVNNHLIILPKP